MKNLLIIGYGNIVKKHVKEIKKIIPKVKFFIITKNQRKYKKIGNLFFLTNLSKINQKKIDYVMICSTTNTHLDYYKKLNKINKPIFIEKPFTHKLENLKKVFKNKRNANSKLLIGYVFRNSEHFKKINHILDKKILGKIKYVEIRASSFLPDWRKNKNYKKTVSAQKKLGGGVLLELSHEIDYMISFFGVPNKIIARSVSKKNLQIDVETGVKSIFVYKNFVIDFQIDFHSKNKNFRYCKIIGSKKTLQWDIKNQIIYLKSINKVNKLKASKNMYNEQMKAFLSKKINNAKLELKSSMRILNIIDQIKKSSKSKQIINYYE